MKKFLLLVLLSLSTSVFASTGGATIATIVDSIGAQLEDVPSMLVGMSYVFGIVLGIKAILKLKEYSESKGQVKLGIPIALAISSALFMALPQFITMGRTTIGYTNTGSVNIKY